MLQGITRLAIAAPRRIIAVTVLILLGAAIFGIPVIDRLSAGGFQDPTSESSQASGLLRNRFGQTDQKMLIVVTAPTGARSDRARRVATDIVDNLKRSPWVLDVSSPWTMPPNQPPQAAAQLLSKDGRSGMIVADLRASLSGDEAVGVGVFSDALAAPLYWIASNAGLDGSVTVNKVSELPAGHGLNAVTLSYGDLVADGVIDPVKVTRSAVLNAASVARMVLTTETAIVEKPAEPDEHDHGHHHHH